MIFPDGLYGAVLLYLAAAVAGTVIFFDDLRRHEIRITGAHLAATVFVVVLASVGGISAYQRWGSEGQAISVLSRPGAPSLFPGGAVSFAIYTRDGKVLAHEHFVEYGLTVTPTEGHRSDGFAYPEYRLRFEREPEHFTVTSLTHGVGAHEPERVGPQEYSVLFEAGGAGSDLVRADFRVDVP